MAKRFTDSEKFRDAWYRKLKPLHKCFWEFLVSECSHAGIWEIDLCSASFHIGEKVTFEDLALFESRIIYLTEDKIFIPSFIKFQQKSLSSSNPAHKNIILELEKYDIPQTLDNIEKKRPFKGASKGLQSPISKGKGKGNSKGNGYLNEKKINKNSSSFEFSGDGFSGVVLNYEPEEMKVLFEEFGTGTEYAFRKLLKKRDDWYSTQPYKTQINWKEHTVKFLVEKRMERNNF